MFANGEGKFTESFRRTTTTTTVSNNFEFPPWFGQSLQFRIQIDAKTIEHCCDSHSVRCHAPTGVLMPSSHSARFLFNSFDSFHVIVVHFRVCSANQLNFMRTSNRRTHACLHVLPSTISAPQTTKKKSTTAKLDASRLPIYGFSIQIFPKYLLTDERKMCCINDEDADTHVRIAHRNGCETDIFGFIFSSIKLPSAVDLRRQANFLGNAPASSEKWPAAISFLAVSTP